MFSIFRGKSASATPGSLQKSTSGGSSKHYPDSDTAVPIMRVAGEVFKSRKTDIQEVRELETRQVTLNDGFNERKGLLSEHDVVAWKGIKNRVYYCRDQMHDATERSKRMKYVSWKVRYSNGVERLERFSKTTSNALLDNGIDDHLARKKAQRKEKVVPLEEVNESQADVKMEAKGTPTMLERSPPNTTSASLDSNSIDPACWKRSLEIYSTSVYATEGYLGSTLLWPTNIKTAVERSAGAIVDWVETVSKKTALFWLWQESDIMKESVLRYIAKKFANNNALASAFFFPSQAPDFDFPRSEFASVLAHELVTYIPSFGDALYKILCTASGPSLFKKAISAQIQHMIVRSYQDLDRRDKMRPLMIIIDGLERCPERHGADIMDAIEHCTQHMPVCFLVSSKRTSWIEVKMRHWSLKSRTVEGVYRVEDSPSDNHVSD